MKKPDYHEYYTREEYETLLDSGVYIDPKFSFKVIEND